MLAAGDANFKRRFLPPSTSRHPATSPIQMQARTCVLRNANRFWPSACCGVLGALYFSMAVNSASRSRNVATCFVIVGVCKSWVMTGCEPAWYFAMIQTNSTV